MIRQIILAALVIASTAFAAGPYLAKVIGITDGDTIKVLHNGEQIKIRLYGIDTPERRQAFGTKAKQFTSDQVFGKTVLVTPMDIDRYGRMVALVQLQDAAGTLNEALVRNGFAWVYRKYCKADFCRDWLKGEQAARVPEDRAMGRPRSNPTMGVQEEMIVLLWKNYLANWNDT